jgi:hypothetical protein
MFWINADAVAAHRKSPFSLFLQVGQSGLQHSFAVDHSKFFRPCSTTGICQQVVYESRIRRAPSTAKPMNSSAFGTEFSFAALHQQLRKTNDHAQRLL